MISNFSLDYISSNDKTFTKIKNDTQFDCIVKINPIPPKRKFIDIFIVKKGTFLVVDGYLILSEISIFFEEENE